DNIPQVFMSLFMIPFLVAGLVLIALSVRQFLALFNPKVRLTVDRAEASPGDVVSLTWQIEGSVDRLKKLSIVFAGEEFATYRRRDDTLTDHHEFAHVSVFESELFGPFGSAKL